jgi:glycosyltransferase involved in cell wall biosynthesis
METGDKDTRIPEQQETNILMILDGLFPPDDRVEKEAVSLMKEGFRVFILCLDYDEFPLREDYKGISVTRLRINRTFRNKIMATYLILPFYRIFWKRAIRKIIKARNIQIIHVHDLPLSDIAIKFKKSGNLKVVCDQHEYYSNWIARTAHYNTKIGKVVNMLSDWKKYEMKNLSAADLVVTVEEPLKKIYISGVRLDEKKIVVLPNTPNISIFNPDRKDEDINRKYRDNFVIFYAGTIDILRGINTIIEALPILRKTVPNLKFIFAGRFTEKYYNPVKYIEKLGVSDMTEYLGWIPIEMLPYYISASHICLHVPPATSTEVNNSVATKIYQYVLMNKPQIVGQAKLMKQFVEQNRIGLSIEESDPRDLAAKILLMHSSPALMEEFISNTKKIAPLYSWDATSRPFIEYYKTLRS